MNSTRLMALSLVLLLGGCGDRNPTGWGGWLDSQEFPA